MNELQFLVEKYAQPALNDFRLKLSEQSPTFKFWDNLIDAIQILLLNLRAEREGDWDLHLKSIVSTLPYYAVADKVNYARWTPIYLIDMIHLPEDAKTAFMKGEFSVHETCGSFKGTASDMATEHKIKELRIPAGLKHIANNESTMIQYTLT